MSKEREGQGVPLTAIHINLKEQAIEFEDQYGTIARLNISPLGVILESELVSARGPYAQAEPAGREREPTVVLTGRLKSKHREGKVDRSGRPTAYARFAAHQEGEEDAHYYLATFHRHTANIALSLPKDAQITVEGYPHPSGTEKRMDTFSVVNIVSYPGKPRKR